MQQTNETSINKQSALNYHYDIMQAFDPDFRFYQT